MEKARRCRFSLPLVRSESGGGTGEDASPGTRPANGRRFGNGHGFRVPPLAALGDATGGFATLAKLSTASGEAASRCVARSYRAQLAVSDTTHMNTTIDSLPGVDGKNHNYATKTCISIRPRNENARAVRKKWGAVPAKHRSPERWLRAPKMRRAKTARRDFITAGGDATDYSFESFSLGSVQTIRPLTLMPGGITTSNPLPFLCCHTAPTSTQVALRSVPSFGSTTMWARCVGFSLLMRIFSIWLLARDCAGSCGHNSGAAAVNLWPTLGCTRTQFRLRDAKRNLRSCGGVDGPEP